MRFALAVLVAFAASASADAQVRFVNACVESAVADGEALPFDPAQVCGCAASSAIVAGVDPVDLDRLIDYVIDDSIDVDNLPAPMQAAGASVMESLLACALAETPGVQGAPSELTRAYGESSDPAVPVALEAQAASAPSAMIAPPAPRLPTGLRTGNGSGPVRTKASGPGGAIRVIQ